MGKTSLIEHLCKELNLTKCPEYPGKIPGKPPTDYKVWLQWVHDVLDGVYGEDILIDRFFFDELVYGPLFRKGIGISIEQKIEIIEKIMSMERFSIIICDSDSEKVKETFNDRDQYINFKDIKDVTDRFYRCTNVYKYRHIFNYRTDPDYKDITNIIRRKLENERK